MIIKLKKCFVFAEQTWKERILHPCIQTNVAYSRRKRETDVEFQECKNRTQVKAFLRLYFAFFTALKINNKELFEQNTNILINPTWLISMTCLFQRTILSNVQIRFNCSS